MLLFLPVLLKLSFPVTRVFNTKKQRKRSQCGERVVFFHDFQYGTPASRQVTLTEIACAAGEGGNKIYIALKSLGFYFY